MGAMMLGRLKQAERDLAVKREEVLKSDVCIPY